MRKIKIHISDILESQRMDVAFHKNSIGNKDLLPLSTYVDIKGGKRIPKGMTFSTERTNYLYLRLSDITDVENIDYDLLKYINEDLYQKLVRYEIKENQIVFSIAGTIGRVFVIKNIPEGKRVILTENCAKLSPKNEDVLPEYISLLLNSSFVQKQIEQNRIQTTIPKIGLDRIGKLKVPKLPSLTCQRDIIKIYHQALAARLEKEQAAKQQLDSIDDYLLDVLHVDKNQATLCSNGYVKNISTILGNRLDVSFYKNRFELISKKYSNVPLSSVAHIDPSISFSGYDANTPISFIPMECIDEIYGEIHVIKSTTILQSKGYTKFEEGDLLWAKITPCMQNGKSAIVKNLENGIGCGSTEFFVLRPRNNNVLIDYIYLLLRHHEVLKAAQSSFGGSAGQQRVSSQYLKSIIIPIPDYSIQKDIVAKIYNMKSQAKQLQKEGDKLLEEAKQKIEKLIFE